MRSGFFQAQVENGQFLPQQLFAAQPFPHQHCGANFVTECDGAGAQITQACLAVGGRGSQDSIQLNLKVCFPNLKLPLVVASIDYYG